MFCAILIDRAEAGESVEQIQLLDGEGWENFQEKSDVAILHWLSRAGFRGEVGQWCALPAQAGQGLKSVARVDREHLRENLAALAAKLPSGTYNVELEDASVDDWYQMGLGWALADYSFDSFKRAAENQRKLDLALGASNDDTEVEDTQAEDEDENSQTRFVELIFPDPEMAQLIEVECEATEIVRDLINTPANVMNPEGLEYAVRVLAEEKGAHFSACVGEDLLSAGFDAIYNVGKASESEPRLVEMQWGNEGPKITIVGKGVCFDSGGLDLKTAEGMRLMKKDMGGAAHALGLASAIMTMELPVRLRVLIPAVENAVSGNAMRPGDVIQMHSGLTVEVGNTDAEGRLVLADAMSFAEQSDLMIDFATLTGAARIALGTGLPAFFTNDEAWAERLRLAGEEVGDPLWRLPLHQPYKSQLKGKVADLCNVSDSSYGGAITAALFLEHFVAEETPWIHFDIMAWNLSSKPSYPEGGEAMGMRAMLHAILHWLSV